MTHLLECHHNERSIGLLDQNLPQWRTLRKKQNGSVLAERSSDVRVRTVNFGQSVHSRLLHEIARS